MKGTKIDFNTWPRAEIFRHFSSDVKCLISVTADVDVTDLVAWCRHGGLRFFVCFMHIVATAVNRRSELRMGYDEDGDVVCWDVVHPIYIDFHREDERITRLASTFSKDFACFYGTVTRDMDENRKRRAFEPADGCRNTFDVSCVPWLYYKAADLHVFSPDIYLPPVITWGGYKDIGGRLMMPLSMRIHHSVADGFHVARFYRDVEAKLGRLVSRPGNGQPG